MIIRDIENSDIKSIVNIYNVYIETSVATFEEAKIDEFELGRRIERILKKGGNWLVAVEDGVSVEGSMCDGEIMGYAYSSDWHQRSAFRFSTEVTAYLSNDHQSKGVGTALYTELFQRIEQNSKHSIIAAITLPNASSISLHEKFGMQKVGHFKEVGFKFRQWLDVGYWQLVLKK